MNLQAGGAALDCGHIHGQLLLCLPRRPLFGAPAQESELLLLFLLLLSLSSLLLLLVLLFIIITINIIIDKPLRRKATMRLNSQQLTMELSRENFGTRSSFKLRGFFTRTVYVAVVDVPKVQITLGTVSKNAVVSGQPSAFRGKFASERFLGALEAVSFDFTADRRFFDFELRTSILSTRSSPRRGDPGCKASSADQITCKISDFQQWCSKACNHCNPKPERTNLPEAPIPEAWKACDLSAELSMKFGTERLEKPLRLMLEVRNSELFPGLPVLIWSFMGSSTWSYKSRNISYNYSYPTYNPTYNYP